MITPKYCVESAATSAASYVSWEDQPQASQHVIDTLLRPAAWRVSYRIGIKLIASAASVLICICEYPETVMSGSLRKPRCVIGRPAAL